MKNFLLLSIVITATLFFSACSTKEVFEPKIVLDDWKAYGDTNDTLIDITSNSALLENRKVMDKSEYLDIKIPQEDRLLSSSDGWIISSNIDGKITLQSIEDNNSIEILNLKKTIASASVKGDVLAVLFADNEMALYSIATQELLLKEQGNAPIIVNSKIVNPYFLNDLVIFSTLDGKIVITNSKLKKKLRTVIISSEDNFNNIIYFNVIDNKLIAATGYKILSLSKKEVRSKYEIRDIAYDDTDIFITTKQGEVISMTPDLQVNAKVKFPFAHFLGMIVSEDKIYVIEKEGYIIELSKDLLTYGVYEVDIEEGFVFVTDTKFFINDGYISIKNEQ